jgi:hypothetical protein
VLSRARVWGVGVVFPHSFYDNVATFEPYNRHFLHDIGAFTIGLGRRDAARPRARGSAADRPPPSGGIAKAAR